MARSSSLHSLYSVMNGLETRLGGGEGIVGCYGSITEQYMERIFQSMGEHTLFDRQSILVDIGAGLGKPLMHAAFQYGIPNSFGVEIDRVKVQKSTAFLSQTMRSMATKGYDMNAIALPRIECAPIEVVPTLEPATHLYSFWEGIPWEAREAVGRLVAESRTIRGIAVVQRAMRGVAPEAEMDELNFGQGMTLVDKFGVKMSGSGKAFTCYIFARETPRMQPWRPAAGAAAVPLVPNAPQRQGAAQPLHANHAAALEVEGAKVEEEGAEEEEQLVERRAAGTQAHARVSIPRAVKKRKLVAMEDEEEDEEAARVVKAADENALVEEEEEKPVAPVRKAARQTTIQAVGAVRKQPTTELQSTTKANKGNAMGGANRPLPPAVVGFGGGRGMQLRGGAGAGAGR